MDLLNAWSQLNSQQTHARIKCNLTQLKLFWLLFSGHDQFIIGWVHLSMEKIFLLLIWVWHQNYFILSLPLVISKAGVSQKIWLMLMLTWRYAPSSCLTLVQSVVEQILALSSATTFRFHAWHASPMLLSSIYRLNCKCTCNLVIKDFTFEREFGHQRLRSKMLVGLVDSPISRIVNQIPSYLILLEPETGEIWIPCIGFDTIFHALYFFLKHSNPSLSHLQPFK